MRASPSPCHFGAVLLSSASAFAEPSSKAEGVDTVGSDAVSALAPIVVTGSRTERPLGEAPVATQLVNREQIDESGARNVAELLAEQPGLYLDRTFAGSALRLSGLPADYTLVLVDGVRVPGRVGGVLDLRRFAIEDIEAVEIVRGAGSALYGSDAIAGVVNLITRRPQRKLEARAEGATGQLGRIDGSGQIGFRKGALSARASAGYHRGSGFDRDPADAATTGSAFEQYNVAGRVEVRPSDDFGVDLFGDYRFLDRRGVDVASGGATLDRQSRTETASVSVSPEWLLPGGARLGAWGSFGLFRDQFALDQRNSAALDELTETREHLAQLGAQLDVDLGDAHHLSLGSEGAYETLSTARLDRSRARRGRVAIYAQDEWTVVEGPSLVALPGARVDVDSQFGAYATPRLALRYDPTTAITLRFSSGLGFKAPDFRELYLLFENPSAGYLVEGSPELRPEKSRDFRLSLEVLATERAWLSLALFHSQLQDRISTNPVASTDVGPRRFRYENVSSASSRGLEAHLRWNLRTDLRLDAGYVFTRARDDDTGEPLAGQPTHRGTLRVRYRHPTFGFETSLRAALVGSRAFFEDGGADELPERITADRYASVDLRVSQRVAPQVSSFLLGENLLDAGDPDYLRLPPRTLSGGVRIDY